MKKVSNKEIAAVFKEAKKYLSLNGSGSKYIYICMAINEVAVKDSTQWVKYRRAKEIIDERLGGACTVVSWLQKNNLIKKDNVDYDQVQQYRHRWLDSLIKEFSK
jgi:hypothetical protein